MACDGAMRDCYAIRCHLAFVSGRVALPFLFCGVALQEGRVRARERCCPCLPPLWDWGGHCCCSTGGARLLRASAGGRGQRAVCVPFERTVELHGAGVRFEWRNSMCSSAASFSLSPRYHSCGRRSPGSIGGGGGGGGASLRLRGVFVAAVVPEHHARRHPVIERRLVGEAFYTGHSARSGGVCVAPAASVLLARASCSVAPRPPPFPPSFPPRPSRGSPASASSSRAFICACLQPGAWRHLGQPAALSQRGAQVGHARLPPAFLTAAFRSQGALSSRPPA